jgi:diacylglycerol kinase family enzyme
VLGPASNPAARTVFECASMSIASSPDVLERLGAAMERQRPARRMLVIVNPYATTVSDRLKHLVVYALQGRYEVDAVDTQAKDHATELCREAAHEGYDVVVAFGGDGTVNEAVNGLRGSDTAFTCLPGGRTNVFARMLGIPNDVVDATEHLLRVADVWEPRRIDLGTVNERAFMFSAGVGLDARVVQRVDAHPRLKVGLGEWYFTWAGVSIFTRRYVLHPPLLAIEAEGRRLEGVLAIVQRSHPYTYFNRRPIELGEGAELANGRLAGTVLKRATMLEIPTVMWRALSKRARIARHRQVDQFLTSEEVTVRSVDGTPVPVQVDGDYIGEMDEARFGVQPRGLTVVA